MRGAEGPHQQCAAVINNTCELVISQVRKIRSFACWYLDPRHITESRMPFIAHSSIEELEALCQIKDRRPSAFDRTFHGATAAD